MRARLSKLAWSTRFLAGGLQPSALPKGALLELPKRDLLVSRTWIQAVALVVVFGFFVLGLLAYRTYAGEAPIPARVVDARGIVLFTGDDIKGGQQVFLRNGL